VAVSGPGRRRRARAALVLIGIVLALLFGTAGPASAHAKVADTSPGDGAVVKVLPEHVTIRFTEPMTLPNGAIRVLAPNGERVDVGDAGPVGGDKETSRIRLKKDLPKGTFTVSWRAVSADSHLISGAFVFSVGKPSASQVDVAKQSGGNTVPWILYGLARFLSYTGYALLVGSAAVVLLCWPRRASLRPFKGVLLSGLAVVTVSALVQFVLRAPYESGDLGEAISWTVWERTLSSDPGRASLARLLMAIMAGVLWSSFARLWDAGLTRLQRVSSIGVAGVLATGMAATWAMTEHASTGPQVGLAVPVSIVHSLAMGIWLGGLATLLTALFRAGPEEGFGVSAVTRFSQLAFTAVAGVVATGIYQSWRQVGSWGALISTDYGRLLILKLGAVLALLGTAWFSRRLVTELRQKAAGEAADAQDRDDRELVPAASAEATAASSSESPAGGNVAARDPGVRPPERLGGVQEGDPGGLDSGKLRTALRRSVTVEAAIAALVLTVTTVLTGADPGRNTEEQAGTAAWLAGPQTAGAEFAKVRFDTGASGGRGRGSVMVTLDPGKKGLNSLTAVTYDRQGGLAAVPELDIAFSLPGRDVGSIKVDTDDVGGYWASDDFQLPLPGRWKMSVTVRTDDFEQTTEEATVQIGK
jgi:copper transport protein